MFDIEKQLYDVAWKDLSKKCRPQYQYKSTLSNVLTIPQFKGFLKYFQLGNFIRMATDYDTVIKLRLISFTVDYNDTSKIDVTFSDAIRVHGVCNDVASIISQANSAAMSFQLNKDQYDKSVNQSNFVEEMRKYGLDVATVQIQNAKNQSQVWDETGMTFRQWNNERNDFDPEQIKIINNQIVFSDDGFKSAKMAIGKIPIDKNGNTVYAVNAEAILGKLFLGEYLTLQNNSGTYKCDDSGFIAKSDNNSIKIQPNNDSEILSIYKGNQKQVYINSDGDVEFAGILKSSSGVFGGLISGGSINLGNGTFTVDPNGNMYAKSGTFSGDIVGGSININNVFTVDSSGNMNATSGKVGGWNISSNGLFSINSNGTYSWITPSSIEIYNPNGSGAGYTVVNYKGIQTTDIIADKIQVETISHSSSQGDGFLHVDADVEFNGNKSVFIGGSFTCTSERSAHFRHTPYIDAPNDDPREASYLAREKWCNNKFALRTDLSRYVTSSDLSEYATKAYVNSVKESIKSWVRSNFKSK